MIDIAGLGVLVDNPANVTSAALLFLPVENELFYRDAQAAAARTSQTESTNSPRRNSRRAWTYTLE